MFELNHRSFLAKTLLLLLLSASGASAATPPSVPDQFKAVPTPPVDVLNLDLSGWQVDELVAEAEQEAEKDHMAQAAQYRYAAISKGDAGYYDLACYYSAMGMPEEASYWLIREVQEGSLEPDYLDSDKCLADVREDENWPVLKKYLLDMSAFWRESGISAVSVVKPKNYKANEPIAVLVGLHGKGDTPLDFVHPSYQTLADDLHIVIVGISGAVPLGKNAFAWTKSTSSNLSHVNKVLDQALTKHQIKKQKAALFGFSQGAQVSLQLASTDPGAWRGAFAMSPGLNPVTALEEDKVSKDLSSQIYFVSNGAQEHPYNLALAKSDIAQIEQHHGTVDHRIYPNQGHRFAADFYAIFPRWVKLVFALK